MNQLNVMSFEGRKDNSFTSRKSFFLKKADNSADKINLLTLFTLTHIQISDTKNKVKDKKEKNTFFSFFTIKIFFTINYTHLTAFQLG